MANVDDIRQMLLAQADPQQTQAPSLLDQAVAAYPRLGSYSKSFAYKYTPSDDDRYLEFYPPGEEDSFDPTRPALQVFNPKTKPSDIAGDIASHYLATGVDPQVTATYKNFEGSLTPKQKDRLQEQYQWAQKHEGEKRPYEDWYRHSGLPAYFRGYAFGQWPHPEVMYTPEQIKMFDDMNAYLKSGPR